MKTILVTGSSRSIGAEIVREAYTLGGYNVVINYKNSRNAAERLCDELQALSANDVSGKKYGKILVVGADVSDESAVDAMFCTAEEQFGKVDILVNNAAVSSFSLFQELTLEAWNETINTNLGSCFLCTKRALPNMLHQKSGKIINISSIWGICGSSCEVHYSASKAAIIGLTKALAKEVAPSGITVNCVAPGVIDTDMNRKALSKDDLEALCEETPLGRLGTPADVAKTVLFLASEAADFITGQIISPNGGLVI